ncbi:MAG TPA: hypothetical protein VN811_14185 [Thermoanaerobaculia bacterium]|nr:hypothetical protein [Thermoanaerobaculia bacterium]HXT52189.1 hypothetical protein [Thermoanaerobaculia bacterium]
MQSAALVQAIAGGTGVGVGVGVGAMIGAGVAAAEWRDGGSSADRRPAQASEVATDMASTSLTPRRQLGERVRRRMLVTLTVPHSPRG